MRESIRLRPKDFLYAVFAASGMWFLTILLWQSLVLSPLNDPKNDTTHRQLFWDNFSYLLSANYTFVSDTTRYDLTADKLTMEDQNSQKLMLGRPGVTATAEDGFWFRLDAQEGVFDREEQVLQLTKDVRMTDQTGTDLRTQAAIVRIEQQVMEGDRPINGQLGQNIQVLSEGFRLKYGEQVQFVGSTEMQIVLGEQS